MRVWKYSGGYLLNHLVKSQRRLATKSERNYTRAYSRLINGYYALLFANVQRYKRLGETLSRISAIVCLNKCR